MKSATHSLLAPVDRRRAPAYSLLALVLLTAFGFVSPPAPAQQTQPGQAQEAVAEPAAEPVEVEKDTAADDVEKEDSDRSRRWSRGDRGDNVIVHIGEDAHLPAGQAVDAIVAVFGSAIAEGEVYEAVVAVFGNARAAGPVHDSVVASFGDVYVNGEVTHDAVAVFGDVELGPQARIGGEAVAIGGSVHRDPEATVHDVQEVSFGAGLQSEALRNWFKHCLRYARMLAFEPGLGWAWGVALGFLALYLAITLLFTRGIEKCVATLETKPGQTVVASLLTMLLTPVLIVLLVVTLVGIAVVPFLGLLLFCAALFGKAVILGALGRRVTRFAGGPFGHIFFAVLVGGLILLGLYLVPVLGIIAYKVTGILGLGVVVYTLLLAAQARRAQQTPGAPPAAAMAASAGASGVNAPSAGAPAVVAGTASVEQAVSAGTEAGGTTSADAQPATPSPTAPPPAVATTLPRAGFWIRMAALMIDLVLIGIVVSLLDPPGDFILLALATYGALMWKLKGTTVGGIILDLKVVRADGRDINWDTAIVRALSCFLSLAVAGLGFIWIVFDENRQAWHDKIAGTLVVRTR